MTPGPADEARRALRAARERATGEADGTGQRADSAGHRGPSASAAPGPGSAAVGEEGQGAGEEGKAAGQAVESPVAGDAGDLAAQDARGLSGERGFGAKGAEISEAVGVESSAAEGARGAAVQGPGGFVVEERGRSADDGAAARVSAEVGGPGVSCGQGAAGAVPEDVVKDPAPTEDVVKDPAPTEDVVKDPAPTEPRPGDAARAALREAVANRRSSVPGADASTGRSDAGTVGARSAAAKEEADRTAEAAPPVEATVDDPPRRPDARPADAAREALRAARRRRADAEAAEAEAAVARRSRRGASTSTPSRDRVRAPRPAAGVRARDVRESLADAFRMPDDVARPGERYEHEGNDPARQGSSGQRQPAADGSPLNTGTADRLTTSTEAPTPTGTNFSVPALESPAPRHPHSMAAPNRDNDLRRTFPAYPPHTSDGARFAATWWGNAWVTALEEGALDAKRLARGRGYAEQGHVDAITVTPGLVLAYVQGSRPRPYRVQVRLRTLGDADWDRFLDLAADRTGHIAALLDREMPQSLAECGVPLLPGPGDLEPQCSCPDRGHPCKHAAALCYQTARLLDADPFVLLLLRGRGERELLDALSRLSAAREAAPARASPLFEDLTS